MSPEFIDLSHVIENGMVTYKGLPAPLICDFLSRERSRDLYEPGTEFQIGKIEMVANTGTYLDCPFHRYENGKDLSEVTLGQCADLEGILLEAHYRNGIEIGRSIFHGKAVRDKAILVHTGWSEHWRTDAYFENHPFLTEDAAIYLRDQGAILVAIDSHNIDDTRGRSRPAHSVLLGAGILIAEHLCNLHALKGKEFRFHAVPPKWKGVGTFPVRAFATCRGDK
jgi:kynurenine formamidase